MSGFEIDLDVIGGLPGPMRSHQASLAGGTTLSSPDTGATTASTRAAIDHVALLAGSFADDLGSIADGLDHALDVYAQTDGERSLFLDFFGKGIYS